MVYVYVHVYVCTASGSAGVDLSSIGSPHTNKILVGRKECLYTPAQYSSTEIRCTLPEGGGDYLTVSLTIYSQGECVRQTYIHIYMHTYIHTYIYAYIHTYIHAYIYTYIHTYIHTYI